MKTNKLIALLAATSLLAVSALPAFASAPADYDGQPYENVGYTSEDPDGEINLAVIAKGKVDIVGDAMYIRGSVYSDDTIYVGNGGGNKVDGLFISGVKGMWDYANPLDGATDDVYRYGYIHVDDDHNMTTNAYSTTLDYDGAILDTNTSYTTEYTPYEIPSIDNFVSTANGNQWYPGAITVSEDTHYGNFDIGGKGLIIDTTSGDVNIVIDYFNPNAGNPEITVKGENKANIYILDASNLSNFNVSVYQDDVDIWSLPGLWAGGYSYKDYPTWDNEVEKFFDAFGNPDVINLYVGQQGQEVVLNGGKMCANIYSNADSIKVGGSARIKGTITSGASDFTIDGEGTWIEGNVVVPNADSLVSGAASILGQVYTDTLTINGSGQIVYKADTAATQVATPEPVVTEAPTEAPTEEPTEAPTLEPIPENEELDLTGVGYAYIFGYEPDKIELVWVDDEEGGHTDWNVEIRMAPNDNVTREQVAAMIMRLIDQKYDTKGASYPVTANIAKHAGTWYERGLAYIASTGAFDGIDEVYTGDVTRGEVAKLVAYGLGLKDTTETTFEDIADSEYKPYIEIMNAYGYMQGLDDKTFQPDRVMTRAEFCSMFNQIIDRQDALLVAADGTQVTPETYYFTDLHDGEWYTPVMLRATSAYDANGYVDIDTRLSNIRNTLDNYDSQKLF